MNLIRPMAAAAALRIADMTLSEQGLDDPRPEFRIDALKRARAAFVAEQPPKREQAAL